MKFKTSPSPASTISMPSWTTLPQSRNSTPSDATPEAPASRPEPSSSISRAPKRRQLSPEVVSVLNKYFNEESAFPSYEEKMVLLSRVQSFSGFETYPFASLDRWFQKKRKVLRDMGELESDSRPHKRQKVTELTEDSICK